MVTIEIFSLSFYDHKFQFDEMSLLPDIHCSLIIWYNYIKYIRLHCVAATQQTVKGLLAYSIFIVDNSLMLNEWGVADP